MAWIKIDKGITESYCFASPNHLKIWIWLLVKSSYKREFISLKNGKGFITVELQRGQVLFGRYKAENELQIDGSTIYRTLEKFKELNQIKIESNNQYSIITICNYDTYQNVNDEDEQPMNNQRTTNEQQANNKRTTSEQQANTYKEDKEVIEYKENIEVNSKIPNENDFLDFCKQELKNEYLGYEFSLKAKYSAWVENKWKDGNGNKIKNWKTKIKNTIPYLKKMPVYAETPPQHFVGTNNSDFEEFKKRHSEMGKSLIP